MDQPELTPDWVLADHIAHLSDWAEEGLRAVEVFGRLGYWMSDPDEGIDDWNERMVARSRGASVESVVARYDRTRAELLDAVARLSVEDLRSPDGWSWTYDCLHGHVRKHLAMIGPWCAANAAGLDGLMPTAPVTPSPHLSIEAIVAVDIPREFRLHPRDRVVAYTAEAAGSRQLFTLSLRGGSRTQLTASEKAVSDPQWSPDGKRLAFVRDEEIWVVEADGSRVSLVVAKPGGGRDPRWSPDGHRLAFLSRRRGWSQVWLIDAPVPRRGRPATEPKPPRPSVLTESGIDVEAFEWAPDGARMAVMARRLPDGSETAQIAIVEVATGVSRVVAGEHSVDVGARWLADGSLLFASDADGWFQVVRLTADGHDRIVLTSGEREHGEPMGAVGSVPLPSPDGLRFVHIEVHDGLQDLVVGDLGGAAAPKRGRGRPPKVPRVVARRPRREPDQPVERRLAIGRVAARRRLGGGHRRT